MAISLLIHIDVINESNELGGICVNEEDERRFLALVTQVQQHEATITQLLEILAATNRKVTEFFSGQEK